MRFEFLLPALVCVKLFGALIRSKDGECQTAEALSFPPLFGGFEEGTAYALLLCLPRRRESSHGHGARP